ncbi:MAG: hypothetical protein J0M18_12260 [Ignavibacteria bacterium]|nr:hypothetical protein [Ignavibacteria bacterium]
MSKPKFELDINIPRTFKLLQTDPATGQSSYGAWWLYNVISEGTEYSFFAPEKVVNNFKQNHVGQQDEITITKKITKSGKANIVDYEINIKKPEQKQQSSNSENPYNDNETMSTDYPVMLQAMSDAVKLREELGVDIDINKLGVTLFLRRVRA